MIHVPDYKLEPNEASRYCTCEICGGDICIGEDYYYIDEIDVCVGCIWDCVRDYTAKLTIPGKHKDFYLQDVCTIERKRCLNELSSNLSHERLRMEREFMRVRGVLWLLIENAAYEDILLHHYDTGYKPQAFIGTLKSFESKYDIHTHFQKDAAYSGAFIYHTLFYAVRNVLKKGVV